MRRDEQEGRSKHNRLTANPVASWVGDRPCLDAQKHRTSVLRHKRSNETDLLDATEYI